VVKRIFFTINPEHMHNGMTKFGERLGTSPIAKQILSSILTSSYPTLHQTVAGIQFSTPVGLAAGFDYEGRLTQILPSVGFGLQTIGTITNMAYEGNPRPLLGRLPRSRSLMVNKGFKNAGAAAMVKKLQRMSFRIPVGISIGRTNSTLLKTQKQSILDIVQAFTLFEKSHVHHSYYELNISCPNLFGDITFYPPKNLRELLTEVDALHLKRPVFIKMPIEKSDEEVLQMLEVIAKHSVAGVIIGNLQKNRNDPSLVQSEVRKFSTGAFSGKPTFNRSNELIALCYKHYKPMTVIGCGGVFSGEDAYKKIRLGATLIQLITGMIFQGPQLIAQINQDLSDYLKRDKLQTISEAVGLDVS
jgi:dihydroorotate dehydrogenase subfamily 2